MGILKTCPRCGRPGRLYVEERRLRSGVKRYVVFYHPDAKEKCYVGPEGEYTYFNLIEDLGLRGLVDERRHLDYLRGALNGLVDEAHRLAREGRREEALRLIEEGLRAVDEARARLEEVKASFQKFGKEG